MVKYLFMQETYSIKLPLFEGPLDLLLHLIRDQKIDIYDIPISLITRQYLEYIEIMKELNLEIAGEFVVMAATLIHIKSRMLLPVEDTADTEEPEDPRMELVMKLLEYQAFKEAALGLKEREEEWTNIYSRSPMDDETEEDNDQPVLFDLNMFDLLSTFQKILEQAPEEVRTLTKETLTIKDKMNVIIEALQSREAMRFEELFRGDIIRSHFIVTFIALLELIRLGLARVYQEEEFGQIWVISPESKKDFGSGYRPPLVEGSHGDEDGGYFSAAPSGEHFSPASTDIILPQRTSFPSWGSPSSFRMHSSPTHTDLWRAPSLEPSPLYRVKMVPQHTAPANRTTHRPLKEKGPDIRRPIESEKAITAPAEPSYCHTELWQCSPVKKQNTGSTLPFKVTFPSDFSTSAASRLPSRKTVLPSRNRPF